MKKKSREKRNQSNWLLVGNWKSNEINILSYTYIYDIHYDSWFLFISHAQTYHWRRLSEWVCVCISYLCFVAVVDQIYFDIFHSLALVFGLVYAYSRFYIKLCALWIFHAIGNFSQTHRVNFNESLFLYMCVCVLTTFRTATMITRNRRCYSH